LFGRRLFLPVAVETETAHAANRTSR
jgi:hypothetical protein